MHVKMCCLALWGALIAAAGPAAADEHDIHAPFEQLFYCTDGDSAYNLYLLPDGTLQARAEEPTLVWSGTYSLNGTEVTVNVSDVSFRETSLFSEVALGFLVAFALRACSAMQLAMRAASLWWGSSGAQRSGIFQT